MAKDVYKQATNSDLPDLLFSDSDNDIDPIRKQFSPGRFDQSRVRSSADIQLAKKYEEQAEEFCVKGGDSVDKGGKPMRRYT